MSLVKPDMTNIWASGGDIVEPSNLKKQQGWTVEVPPHQFENWIQNRQDAYLAHINQRGIPAWDGLTNYLASGLSYVQGTNGKVYKSVAASGPAGVVSNPVTDVAGTYWTVAFADVGAFLTQADGDTRYTQRSNNLSDVSNAATARTNLGIVQATDTTSGLVELATNAEAQTGTDTTRAITPAGLASLTATDARRGLVELATNAEAQTGTDTTRAITPAGLASLTATDARRGLVELATNAEAQTGTDTTRAITPAGFLSAFGSSLSTNGYQRLPSGLIIQWGSVALSSTQTLAVTLPIAFSVAGFQGFAGSTATGVSLSDQVAVNVTAISTTQITLNNTAPAARTARWFAIGN